LDNKNYTPGYDLRRDLEIARDFNGTNRYVTDLLTEEAVKIIKNHKGSKPLYLQVNHLAPHCANKPTSIPNAPKNYTFDEMQALPEDFAKFPYINTEKDDYRRKLAGKIIVVIG
jgi:hypothetical protein